MMFIVSSRVLFVLFASGSLLSSGADGAPNAAPSGELLLSIDGYYQEFIIYIRRESVQRSICSVQTHCVK